MGKASPSQGREAEGLRLPSESGQGVSQRTILFVTIGVIVVIVAGSIGYSQLKSSPSKPPPAAASAADKNAPASLVKAAQRRRLPRRGPTPGVGRSISKPASAATRPANPNLLPVGHEGPRLHAEDPDRAQKVSLSSTGKGRAAQFFATWCPHCNAEAPYLKKLYVVATSKHLRIRLGQRPRRDGAERVCIPPLLRPPVSGPRRPEPSARQLLGRKAQQVQGHERLQGPPPTRPSTSSTHRERSPGANDGEQPDALLVQQLKKAAGA